MKTLGSNLLGRFFCDLLVSCYKSAPYYRFRALFYYQPCLLYLLFYCFCLFTKNFFWYPRHPRFSKWKYSSRPRDVWTLYQIFSRTALLLCQQVFYHYSYVILIWLEPAGNRSGSARVICLQYLKIYIIETIIFIKNSDS